MCQQPCPIQAIRAASTLYAVGVRAHTGALTNRLAGLDVSQRLPGCSTGKGDPTPAGDAEDRQTPSALALLMA